MAQMVKNPLAMQEVWVQPLDQEHPLEEEMATHSSILALENPMDRGAWWAIVHGRNKQSPLSHHIFQCLCDSSLACTLTNACDFLLPQLCTKNHEAILACTNLKSRRKKNHGQVTEESAVFICPNHPSLGQGWRGPHPHQGVLHRLA